MSLRISGAEPSWEQRKIITMEMAAMRESIEISHMISQFSAEMLENVTGHEEFENFQKLVLQFENGENLTEIEMVDFNEFSNKIKDSWNWMMQEMLKTIFKDLEHHNKTVLTWNAIFCKIFFSFHFKN